MPDYEAVPLKGLRDQLGRVVSEVTDSGRPVVVTRGGQEVAAIVPAAVLRSGALPAGFFDEQGRREYAADLQARLATYPAAEVADAQARVRKLQARAASLASTKPSGVV